MRTFFVRGAAFAHVIPDLADLSVILSTLQHAGHALSKSNSEQATNQTIDGGVKWLRIDPGAFKSPAAMLLTFGITLPVESIGPRMLVPLRGFFCASPV